MLVESILMELRSRLRSCNVFITTGINFTKECNLKISIQANCIILNYYNNDFKSLRRDSLSSIESLSDCYSEDEMDFCSTIEIAEFCRVIPNSMSCLKIDKNTVSFRILTEPKLGGNFYKEIITANGVHKSVEADKLIINMKIGVGAKLTCSNCSNVISDGSVDFGRILELPTANLDISEWFCHGHGHGHNSSTDSILKPNKTDFLYRLTYFVVNQSLLSDKTNKFNSKRNIYHCNRCLAWLGLKNQDTVKLYNSEVKMCENNDIEKHVFSQKNETGNVHLNDFIYTIENMTREFNLGLQYTVMCKIVLECKISATTHHFLLIWVMDKELQVLRNNEHSFVNDKIELQSTLVTKILYKIHLFHNEEVESWISDPVVISTDISKSMFTHGVEHLQNMSLKVPEPFRNTNGYCVSYLKV